MARGPLAFSRVGKLGGPAVVFLHGFLGCREDWLDVVAPLKSDHDILLVDLPGHGASTTVSDEVFTLDGCAKVLCETLTSLRIGSCSLVGYSMGGRIAMHAALSAETAIGSLVLIGAHPGLESDCERAARLALDLQWGSQLARQSLESFVDAWYQQSIFVSLRHSPAFAGVRSRRIWGDPALLSRALTGLSVGHQKPLWQRMKLSDMPIRYIAGELDTKYCEVGKRLADLCPQSKLDIIPGAGHAVHLERPEEVTRVICSFLATQS